MTPTEANALLTSMQALSLMPRNLAPDEREVMALEWSRALPAGFGLEECLEAAREVAAEPGERPMFAPRPGVIQMAVYRIRARKREAEGGAHVPEQPPEPAAEDYGTRGRPFWDYPAQAREVQAVVRANPRHPRETPLAYIARLAVAAGLIAADAEPVGAMPAREPGMEG